jgi:hypothetical protein
MVASFILNDKCSMQGFSIRFAKTDRKAYAKKDES